MGPAWGLLRELEFSAGGGAGEFGDTVFLTLRSRLAQFPALHN